MDNVIKIVLTGGPYAGKTTILDLLKERYGHMMVFLPEVATTLLDSGYKMDSDPPSPEWQSKFQTAILKAQIELEDKAVAEAARGVCKLVICDRGILDGAAYTPGGVEAFCKLHGLDQQEMISRYGTVVHMETRAIAAPHEYGDASNEHRHEGVEAALALDKATWLAWENHPRHVRALSAQGIMAKFRLMDMIIDFSLRSQH